jgi:hypothetical protein
LSGAGPRSGGLAKTVLVSPDPVRSPHMPLGKLDLAGLTVSLAAVPEQGAGQAAGELDGEADAGDKDARLEVDGSEAGWQALPAAAA